MFLSDKKVLDFTRNVNFFYYLKKYLKNFNK